VYYLLPRGKIDSAIQELRIAEKSAPLFANFLDDALEDAGRDKEALAYCETNADTKGCGLGARIRLGRSAEVIQMHDADPDKVPATPLGCAFAHVGRREEAERLTPKEIGGSGGMEIYACLGDKERVFEALERAAGLGRFESAGFCCAWTASIAGCLRAIRGYRLCGRRSACRNSRFPAR
jgi:hypothetical protein